MIPNYPILYIDEITIELENAPNTVIKVQSSKLIDPVEFENCDVYDSNGYKWKFQFASDKIKNTFWKRLLIYIYNPRVESEIVWKNIGPYDLQELKTNINKCVDADDDIIKQYVEGSIIKKAIDNTKSFKEIISLLNKYVFEVNEQELWNEQDEKDNS